MRHRLLLAVTLAAATFAVDAGAKQHAAGHHAARRAAEPVAVDVAPPSGTWEATPPPAEGYVWSAGFFEWKDGRYVWKPGEWVLARPGLQYRQHQWVQRSDGKWILTGGDWVKPQDSVTGQR